MIASLLRPKSMSSTITTTINSFVVMKTSMKMKRGNSSMQQSTIVTWVIGVIVDGLIPISTSYFNIKSCYHIARGIVAGILWPRSTSINISSTITSGILDGQTWPTSTTFVITWGRAYGLLMPMSKTFTTSTITWRRVDGLKRPMSITFRTQRHFNTFFFRTFMLLLLWWEE